MREQHGQHGQHREHGEHGEHGGGRPRRRLAVRPTRGEALAAAAVLLALVVYAVDDRYLVDRACYDGTLVGAAIAAWVGAERGPVADRTVPRLIALGLSLSAMGDVLWDLLDALGRDTDVSVADAPWLASYVALALGVWMVIARSRSDRGRDAAFVVDALTITVVSVLVFWRLEVSAIITQDDLTPIAKLVWSSYPVLDAVLLALVARALTSSRARRAIDVTFALGVVIWLLADTGPLVLPYEGASQLAIDAGWMVAPVLLARAAWRAGDVVAERDVVGSGSGAGDAEGPADLHGWVVPLSIAVLPLLVPPALEVVGDVRLGESHPVALALGTVSLVALALARTALLMSSERHHVRELVTARDAALEASRAKSLFVATMSHEIRTPLTTLVGAMDMVRDTDLDDDQRFLVDRMGRASTRLRSLVEDVLDFSVIEAGRLDLSLAEVDLHRLLDDLREVYDPLAAGAGLSLSWHRDAGVPRAVAADATRLQQVLGNLLDNAVKFTPAGSVGLRVATVGASPDGDPVVVFSVSDTGVGIPADRLVAVFESFTQADGSPTRPYEGSGLGLTISRRLVELMGGTLAVTSEVGRGTTFEARIPLRTCVAPVADRTS